MAPLLQQEIHCSKLGQNYHSSPLLTLPVTDEDLQSLVYKIQPYSTYSAHCPLRQSQQYCNRCISNVEYCLLSCCYDFNCFIPTCYQRRNCNFLATNYNSLAIISGMFYSCMGRLPSSLGHFWSWIWYICQWRANMSSASCNYLVGTRS
jgi:hypothetical protein